MSRRPETSEPLEEPAATTLTEDQRREPRHPADGEVTIRFGDPQREIRGQLVDVSASGFRIAHGSSSLETGQAVEFSHPEAHGKAVVIWNRITESGVQTGLMLIKS